MIWSDWKTFNVTSAASGAGPAVDPAAQIVGGAGDDTLVGTSAKNVLTGGGGSDTFLFAVNFGTNTVTDFQATGAEHDVVVFSQAMFNDFATVLAHATQIGTDVVIAADAANTVTLKNVAIANLQSSDVHII
jgi:Ca2+-binding RTX toxin-like protein